MNLSRRIHDQAIRDTIQALRYEAGLSRRVLVHLKALERDLKAAIAEAGVPTSQRKLKALLREAQELIQERFGGAQGVFDDEIPQFVSARSEATRAALNGLVKVDIWRHSLTQEQIQAIASDTLISGAPSAEWWAAQQTDTAMRFARIVRGGMLRGSTADEMAREVRDAMGITMRNAQSLVRTSVISVNNAAQVALYDANADLLNGLEWTATLDRRTCAACGSLDGQTWKTGEKHPQPALHFGCRCVLTPWLKSWEELAKEQGGDTALARELDRMDPGTRASMDGQVSGTMTYSDWLARQDRASLDTILGPGRAKLYASGKVGLSDLVDHAGNEISLKDLRKAL